MYQNRATVLTSTANTGWKIGRIEAKTNAQTVCNRNFTLFSCSIQRCLCNATIYRSNFQSVRIANRSRSSINHFKCYGQFRRFGIHLFGSICWKATHIFINGISHIFMLLGHLFVRVHRFTQRLHVIQSSESNVSFGKSKSRLYSRDLSLSLELLFVLRISFDTMDTFVGTFFLQVSEFWRDLVMEKK